MPSTCKITFFSHLYIKSIQYFMFVNFQHNIIYKTTPHHCESSYSCHGNYIKHSLLRHEISTSKNPQARRIYTGVISLHCQNHHFHLFRFPGLNFRRLSFSSWRCPWKCHGGVTCLRHFWRELSQLSMPVTPDCYHQVPYLAQGFSIC